MKNRLSKLRGKMSEEDINQGDLGERIQKSQTYVSDRINCKHPFDMNEVYIICDWLHIPYSEIPEYFPPITNLKGDKSAWRR